jgi:hypothetical protein
MVAVWLLRKTRIDTVKVDNVYDSCLKSAPQDKQCKTLARRQRGSKSAGFSFSTHQPTHRLSQLRSLFARLSNFLGNDARFPALSVYEQMGERLSHLAGVFGPMQPQL